MPSIDEPERYGKGAIARADRWRGLLSGLLVVTSRSTRFKQQLAKPSADGSRRSQEAVHPRLTRSEDTYPFRRAQVSGSRID